MQLLQGIGAEGNERERPKTRDSEMRAHELEIVGNDPYPRGRIFTNGNDPIDLRLGRIGQDDDHFIDFFAVEYLLQLVNLAQIQIPQIRRRLFINKAFNPIPEMGIGRDGVVKPQADFTAANDQDMDEVAAFFLQPSKDHS